MAKLKKRAKDKFGEKSAKDNKPKRQVKKIEEDKDEWDSYIPKRPPKVPSKIEEYEEDSFVP